MLTGKTKRLYELLNNNSGDWVSVRQCVITLWGESSFDSKLEEIKWRRNLSGQISHMKSKLEKKYRIEKSKSLDAIRLINSQTNCNFQSEKRCIGCSAFILNVKENSECSYCVECLCKMMEDLGL